MDELRERVVKALGDLHAVGEYGADDEADTVLNEITTAHVLIERDRWERVQSAVRQGKRLQAILHAQFGYIDQYGMPILPGDLDDPS